MTKRKTRAERELGGNAGKRPLPAGGPQPVPASTRAPRGLQRGALKIWRKLAPLLSRRGILDELDTFSLSDACVVLYRLREAEAILERDGLIVEGYRGSLVKHPATTIAASYRAAWQRYATKFGLSPSERTGIEVAIEDEPDDLAELLFRVAGGRRQQNAGPTEQ